jgi:hypothetical protein
MAEQEPEVRYVEIEGFEHYLLYEDGRVFNKNTGYWKKVYTGANGYPTVTLWRDGREKHLTIHRLLATYFLPNPDEKAEVDHMDGDRANNSLDNLRWASRTENAQNVTRPRHNTSGEKNVYWYKPYKKWKVMMGVNKQQKFFGYFDNYDDAVEFARAKRKELHGDFARDA